MLINFLLKLFDKAHKKVDYDFKKSTDFCNYG